MSGDACLDATCSGDSFSRLKTLTWNKGSVGGSVDGNTNGERKQQIRAGYEKCELAVSPQAAALGACRGSVQTVWDIVIIPTLVRFNSTLSVHKTKRRVQCV